MKKKILILFLLLTTSWACDDLLEKTDLTGVDERVWDTESTATLYLNRLYDMIMPMYPNMRSVKTVPTALHVISDESNTGDNRILYGTVAINNINDFSADSKDNAWFFIRKVNILLTEIVKGDIDDVARNKIMAQAYFLRAWVYFNLVKLYGGVPIITHPQDWTTEDLYVKREKTSTCIDFIVEDLDRAIEMLASGMPATQSNTERGRLTRDAAMAVKGRVLLFWASPQFNPGDDGARWERAYNANKAAFDTLTAHGYALFPNFSEVLTNETPSNKEVIMIRSYDGLNAPNSFENGARPVSESDGGGGSFHPTWELVKAFPMKDGTPSMVNGVAANGFDTVYYWKDRDPRFKATIAYNGCIWPLSGQPARKQWNYVGVKEDNSKQTTTGFYCRKGVDAAKPKASAKQGAVDWVEMRFAEVMLNLAECANATDKRAEAYTMLKAIRQRAGIIDNNGEYGLEPGMDEAAMFNAIIEERRIELAFEGKRHDDLRRNRLFHLLNGKRRNALLITPKNKATLEATAAGGVMFRETLDLDGPDYTTYFTPTFKTIDNNNVINFKYGAGDDLQSYYFFAIPTQNIDRNPNLLQTVNWANGTFDPLE